MKVVCILLACLLMTSTMAMESFLKEKVEETHVAREALKEDDSKSSINIIIRSKGYPFESHKVLTEDGYWITMFRIPGTKGETREEAIAKKKPAIYLQHGILDSSDTFIVNDEERSPALQLARAGYDVWLGNTRGNKYSRDHQWLDPNDSNDKLSFFDYTFDEMAHYDVPAMIEYVRSVTGKTKIAVGAHSQGTTQMLVRMSDDNAWWNDRVSIFVCLAGVAKLDHIETELFKFLAKQEFIINTLKLLGVEEMFPSDYLQNKIFATVCTAVPSICDLFIKMISDADTSLNNQERVGVFMGHYPAGTSLRSLDHFSQLVRTGKFQRYDYGEKGNMEKYGQKTPPEYNLKNIQNAKIIQIAGTADKLSDLTDDRWLHEQIRDNVVYYGEYELGHMSFILAKDMTYFHVVLDHLKKYAWD